MTAPRVGPGALWQRLRGRRPRAELGALRSRLQTAYSRMAMRDALRLGLQGAAAAAGVYLIMESLDLAETYAGILAAVFILSRSPDGSLGAGIDRIASAVVGSLTGIACLALLPYGIGTAVSLAVTMFLLSAIATLRPAWSYGMIAAVALSLGSGEDTVEVAMDRGLAILVGVATGVAVSLIVWPEFARQRYAYHRRRVLLALSARLDQIADATYSSETSPVHEDADHRFNQALRDAQATIDGTRFGEAGDERDDLRRMERIYSAIMVLDRALDGGWHTGDRTDQLMSSVAKALHALAVGELADLPEPVRLDPLETDTDDDRSRRAVLQFGLNDLVRETRALAEG